MPRSERRWRCANTQELAVYVLTHAIKEAVQGRETDVLAAIGVAWTGSSRHIHCPYSDHEDKDPSWRWDGNKDRAYCTCAKGDGILDVVMKVLGLDFSAAKVQVAEILGRKDLICRKRGERGHTPLNDTATAQRSGCTLAEYAEAKHIPAEFLTEIGLTQITYNGAPALRMPYMDIAGKEVAVRYRVALQKTETGDNRFRWKKGDKPSLYGLWRMKQAYKAGYVILVEGESDCHMLWHHNIPTVGIPGATNWKEDRDAEVLDGIGTVYVVIEPDQGGGTVKKWLSNSGIRDRARMIDLGKHEDPSALCLDDPNRFEERWQAALEAAVPWQDLVAKEAEVARQDAWRQCSSLAHDAGILDRFADDIRHSGVVGEDRIAKLIFLALTSRFLDRPVSVAVKGPSSGGKSFVVEKVLSFFPDDAYHALTGMSERALAYGEEPLKHRFLVIYEAAGLQGEIGAYLNRLVVDAPKGVITPSLTDVLQRQKSEIIALLVATVDGWSREDWLAIYDERAGIVEYDGGVSRSEAEAQAYECCVSEWMNRNPSPSPPCCCAWCGETEDVGDCVVLPFGTEAHGHTWLHRRCWGDWFEMRRNRAMKALATLGILAPVSIPDEPRNLIAGGS